MFLLTHNPQAWKNRLLAVIVLLEGRAVRSTKGWGVSKGFVLLGLGRLLGRGGSRRIFLRLSSSKRILSWRQRRAGSRRRHSCFSSVFRLILRLSFVEMKDRRGRNRSRFVFAMSLRTELADWKRRTQVLVTIGPFVVSTDRSRRCINLWNQVGRSNRSKQRIHCNSSRTPGSSCSNGRMNALHGFSRRKLFIGQPSIGRMVAVVDVVVVVATVIASDRG